MSNEKPVELTEAERDQLAVWWDDNDLNSSMNALCREVAAIVKAREAAARREALLEAADAWDNADPRDLDYLARRFYRAGGPSTPTIWLRRRAEALAEPERDEESGR